MSRPSQPVAAGAPLAITTIAGAVIGAIEHQPTLGVIGGVAVGTAIALVLWLRDRAKIGE